MLTARHKNSGKINPKSKLPISQETSDHYFGLLRSRALIIHKTTPKMFNILKPSSGFPQSKQLARHHSKYIPSDKAHSKSFYFKI